MSSYRYSPLLVGTTVPVSKTVTVAYEATKGISQTAQAPLESTAPTAVSATKSIAYEAPAGVAKTVAAVWETTGVITSKTAPVEALTGISKTVNVEWEALGQLGFFQLDQSAGVINDATRTADVNGDNRPPESSTIISLAETNLLTNGNPDVDLTDWSVVGAAFSLARITSTPIFGPAAASVTADGANTGVQCSKAGLALDAGWIAGLGWAMRKTGSTKLAKARLIVTYSDASQTIGAYSTPIALDTLNQALLFEAPAVYADPPAGQTVSAVALQIVTDTHAQWQLVAGGFMITRGRQRAVAYHRTTRPAGRVTLEDIPAELDAERFGIVFRGRLPVGELEAKYDGRNSRHTIGYWADPANPSEEYVWTYLRTEGWKVVFERCSGGKTRMLERPGPPGGARGDPITVIAAGLTTGLKVSVNGAPFTNGTYWDVPTLVPDQFGAEPWQTAFRSGPDGVHGISGLDEYDEFGNPYPKRKVAGSLATPNVIMLNWTGLVSGTVPAGCLTYDPIDETWDLRNLLNYGNIGWSNPNQFSTQHKTVISSVPTTLLCGNALAAGFDPADPVVGNELWIKLDSGWKLFRFTGATTTGLTGVTTDDGSTVNVWLEARVTQARTRIRFRNVWSAHKHYEGFVPAESTVATAFLSPRSRFARLLTSVPAGTAPASVTVLESTANWAASGETNIGTDRVTYTARTTVAPFVLSGLGWPVGGASHGWKGDSTTGTLVRSVTGLDSIGGPLERDVVLASTAGFPASSGKLCVILADDQAFTYTGKDPDGQTLHGCVFGQRTPWSDINVPVGTRARLALDANVQALSFGGGFDDDNAPGAYIDVRDVRLLGPIAAQGSIAIGSITLGGNESRYENIVIDHYIGDAVHAINHHNNTRIKRLTISLHPDYLAGGDGNTIHADPLKIMGGSWDADKIGWRDLFLWGWMANPGFFPEMHPNWTTEMYGPCFNLRASRIVSPRGIIKVSGIGTYVEQSWYDPAVMSAGAKTPIEVDFSGMAAAPVPIGATTVPLFSAAQIPAVSGSNGPVANALLTNQTVTEGGSITFVPTWDAAGAGNWMLFKNVSQVGLCALEEGGNRCLLLYDFRNNDTINGIRILYQEGSLSYTTAATLHRSIVAFTVGGLRYWFVYKAVSVPLSQLQQCFGITVEVPGGATLSRGHGDSQFAASEIRQGQTKALATSQWTATAETVPPIPTTLGPIDIGSVDGIKHHWNEACFYMGITTDPDQLTDAFAATLHAAGDADPDFDLLPPGFVFLWTAANASWQGPSSGITSQKQTQWENTGAINATALTAYEALKSETQSKQAAWEALLGLGTSASAPFESITVGSVSKLAVVPIETLKAIAATLGVPWEAPGRVSKATAAQWETFQALISAFMPKAVGIVQFQWDPFFISGFAQLDESLLGGPDVLAPSGFVFQFNGPFDDLTHLVDRIQITRGRDDLLGPMQAATASLEVRDHDGMLNPENPSSPLFGQVLPLTLARVGLVFDSTTFWRFVGFLDTDQHKPGPRRGTATIALIDLFVRLQRDKPVIFEMRNTTTGAVIGRILDVVGWTDPALRSIAQGDPIPYFRADGTQTALHLIEELLISERGVFFIAHARGGVATYLDRHAVSTALSSATLPTEVRAIAPGTTLDRIRNRAKIVRLNPETREELTTAEYEDAISSRRYGASDFEDIQTTYLANNNQAEDLARYMVESSKDPRSPIYGLALTNTTDQLFQQILERELQQVVTATTTAGVVGDYVVEQIQETIEATGRVSAEWRLSRRPAKRPIVVGFSQLDSDDVLTY